MTRVMAPAKLTLSLAVTGARSDGYHQLRSEMVSLSLSDELVFAEGDTGLTVAADAGHRAEWPGREEHNLVRCGHLAAVGRRAAVHLTKRIPLGGGLGGGSTDAAAVLRWAGCRRSRASRPEALGSDVPFSVVGGRALVEGTGAGRSHRWTSWRGRSWLLGPAVWRQYGEGLCGLGRVDGSAPRARGGQCTHGGGARGRTEAGPMARRTEGALGSATHIGR